MDIDILLIWQAFRNGPGSCMLSFMSKMTFLGETNTVLILAALIYWCVNKDFGNCLLMSLTGSRVVNGFLKITACVYRPWIRDPRIIPDQEAIKTATGYSFPSGHSTNAGAIYGGMATRKELAKALRITVGIIAVLIALSRNFLDVHTPQDILVGLCSGVLVMWLTTKLMAWIDKNPEKDIMVMCIGMGISILVAIYAAIKTYPVDYDETGKILVEGTKMAVDTYRAIGLCFGYLIGWFLERRYLHFSTDVSMMSKLTRLAIGALSFYVVNLIINSLLKTFIPGVAGSIITNFVPMFYISFIFPWIIKRFDL